MAKLVGVLAVSHAPGITGWFDKATDAEQRTLSKGFAALAADLRDLRPDVIVGIANDHLMNLPFGNMPDFCVGTAPRWHGPTTWYRDRLNVPDFTIAGDVDLAREIVRSAARDGTRLAFANELEFTDNWVIPLRMLTPAYDVPFVPIHMNCIVQPIPSPHLCFDVGGVIANAIRRDASDKRVVILATGGLSHDPGGPKYFQVDEAFDRWFLDIMCSRDTARILREVTIERMLEAGEGGTPELLAWLVALGAAGDRPARSPFYEPTVAFRCGTGAIVWDMDVVNSAEMVRA